ncbi:MAG: hypothetical protein V7L14_08230 [Nostoc sp.]|uniref:hypothetical protein n=1 Tax=Nostoc sp. TaxID=1180 RepID=UPI002FF5602A
MNIIEQTSNKLTLHNPALGAWIFGSVIASVAIFIPLFCAGKTIHIFSCDRASANEGVCEIQEINRWRKEQKIFRLDELKGANVESHITYDKKGQENITYRVYILTASENIYFIGNGERNYLDNLTNQINEFVNNSTEPSLKIITISDNSLVMYIIGAVLGVFSLALVSADDIICSFDKSSGIFYIKKQGMRGKRLKSERNTTISDIRIEESNRLQNKQTGKIHITYKLSLVLKSGESLFLDSGSNIENYQKIENNIRQILK